MGKGRDKRKKNEDPAKLAKRAARQAHKLKKGAERGEEAPQGFNNEESIEVTLKRIQKAQSKLRTTEEVANVPPPTPRANGIFIAHPERDGEFILFGGEFWNGEVTEAYNDTYFYHTKRNAWAKLASATNPSPRSSSQGITYKHYVIIFGGEFVSQTQSQYHHFRDVWRFNSRSSEWEELRSLKGGPSSRSGHRMLLWKRNAIVFGGFYDNAQESRYYNDLWMLSSLEGTGHWTQIKTAELGEVPHARSGHNMSVHGDTLFVCGGYSTEKFNRFKKSEATVHHDLWMIRLGADEQAGAPLPMWTKIRFGGVPPPIRSGVASAFKDKKMYLFGGVVDIESPGGKLVSTFSNDLFVFHMDTKRFYPVVLRKTVKKVTGGQQKEDLNDLQAQLNELRLQGGDDSSSSGEDESESESDTSDGTESGKKMEANEETKESFVVSKNGQLYPHKRMDAAMQIVGNYLYIYGGQFEKGKKEITLSDMFSLNLNKLDTYNVLLSQDLSTAVWMGKETESNAGSWESGSTVVSAAFDLDYDEEDEDDEREGVDFSQIPREGVLGEDENGDEAPEAIPAELDMHVTPAHAEIAGAIDGTKLTRGKKGLKAHKEQLLAQLGAAATVPTPTVDELFADFYSRTAAFWEEMAEESYGGGSGVKRSRVKREATEFARRRFHEAKELLQQLQLVEEREREEARFFRERRLQKEKEWEQYEQELQQQSDDEANADEKAEDK